MRFGLPADPVDQFKESKRRAEPLIYVRSPSCGSTIAGLGSARRRVRDPSNPDRCCDIMRLAARGRVHPPRLNVSHIAMASTGDSRYAPPTASVADVAPTQGAARLASRWRRLGAYVIDALLMVAAAALIARLAHWNLFDPASLRRPHVNMLIGVSAFMLLN